MAANNLIRDIKIEEKNMTLEEIEQLIKKYGYEKSDSMHCSHVGLAYDENRIERAYAKLLEAIKQYKEQK